jgi:hypothetical protein
LQSDCNTISLISHSVIAIEMEIAIAKAGQIRYQEEMISAQFCRQIAPILST